MSKSAKDPEQFKASIGGRITSISKAEPGLNDITSRVIPQEEAFEGMMDVDYFGREDEDERKVVLVSPPYNLHKLAELVEENNALDQCISAMEVNIDGTGYVFTREHNDEPLDVQSEGLEPIAEFFDEPYPLESFVTMRRSLRRDLEIFGHGYLEIVRNPAGEIMMLRHVPTLSMRLVKLGAPVQRTVRLNRRGKDSQVKMAHRPRAFCQDVGGNKVFFKEYGLDIDLDYKTGEWSDRRLPADVRASEILYFTVTDSPLTPYGIPRWIPQIPCVLGSREAEELNLEFFESGGLPPAMIIVQGGQMTEEVRAELQNYLEGKAKNKSRAAIVEAHSTSGTLESAGNVRVNVERFGDARQTDAMFQKYDEGCEKKIRSSFRLPSIFVGRTDAMNFATAHASYAVAEAQVFGPERHEFDERINVTIMRELDATGEFRIASRPLNVKDVQNQLRALDLAARNDAVTKGSLVEAINSITNTSLRVVEGVEDEPATGGAKPQGRQLEHNVEDTEADAPDENDSQTAKSESGPVIQMAEDFVDYLFKRGSMSEDEAYELSNWLGGFPRNQQKAFKGTVRGLISEENDGPEKDEALATLVAYGV